MAFEEAPAGIEFEQQVRQRLQDGLGAGLGHAQLALHLIVAQQVAHAVAEVERVARSGATLNVFALDPEPALVHFVHYITQRAGGRVFTPDTDRLGEYVVSDYLRSRKR